MSAAVAYPALPRTFGAFMAWTPERIHALRKRLRLNQSEFGRMLGYTRYQSVSDLEKGKMEPSGAVEILLDIIEKHGGLPGREGEAGA